MNENFKHNINRVLSVCDLRLTRRTKFESIKQAEILHKSREEQFENERVKYLYDINYYSENLHYLDTRVEALIAFGFSTKEIRLNQYLLRNFKKAKSQLLLDLLVAYLCEDKSGSFVEFGAADGLTLSNSYYLEKQLGWQGALAEPARGWQAELSRNRSCHISDKCIFSNSNETLMLVETSNRMLSTIDKFKSSDFHAENRFQSNTYPVLTQSLEDFLTEHFPNLTQIDFLSIDTEGSELEILRNFDFSKFQFGCIAIEHNFNSNTSELRQILTTAGYIRIFEQVSRWDDWWVDPQLASRFVDFDSIASRELGST